MIHLLLIGGGAALSAKGATSIIDTVCDYVVKRQEETRAVVWKVDVLGKTVSIWTDIEYDAFEVLFDGCREASRGIDDRTNGQGSRLVLWCMLRWACYGDSMFGLLQSIRRKDAAVADMLGDALLNIDEDTKRAALLLVPRIKEQEAAPPAYPI